MTRLEILLDGEEQLLIDKINFIHRVKGNDLLAAVRVRLDSTHRRKHHEKDRASHPGAPITVQGKKADILTLRRATLGDDGDAMDMAISFNRGTTCHRRAVHVVHRAGFRRARTLDEDDIGAIRAAHNSLRPAKPKKRGGRNRDGLRRKGKGSGLRQRCCRWRNSAAGAGRKSCNLTPEAFVAMPTPQRYGQWRVRFGVFFQLGSEPRREFRLIVQGASDRIVASPQALPGHGRSPVQARWGAAMSHRDEIKAQVAELKEVGLHFAE